MTTTKRFVDRRKGREKEEKRDRNINSLRGLKKW
jgi:hypothetical protein